MPDKIRAALEALADALEEALSSAAPAEEAEEEEEAPPPKKAKGKAKPKKTMDDVRNALVALNAEHGKAAVVDVLGRFGITKVGDLDEEHYVEAIDMAESYEAKEEDEEEEEDPPPKKRGKKAPPPEEEDEEEDEEEEEEAPPPRRRRR